MTSGGWNASFIYNYTGTTNSPADGMTFALENDPRGAGALGGGGGQLGYGGGFSTTPINGSNGIINSESFPINVYSGDGGQGVSQYPNAGTVNAYGGSYLSTSPVSVTGGTMGIDLSFNGGSSVTETLTQGTNTYSTTYSVPAYQSVLGGGNTAYVGFTGATGGLNAGQQISDFQFTPTGSQVPKTINIFHPGDVVAGIQTSGGSANSPSAEPAPSAVDSNAQSKYLNFNQVGAGIFEMPAIGATVANGLVLTSANDSPERDPASYEVWGTNDPNNSDINPVVNNNWQSSYTLISSGAVPTFAGRFSEQFIPFTNTGSYTSYVVDFPSVANPSAANSMQIADIQLSGQLAVPEPGTFALFAVAGAGLLVVRLRRRG
jgi:hypothetical protein